MFKTYKLTILNWFVFFMCQFYLLIDAFSGYLAISMGTNFGLSILYKTILLILVIMILIFNNLRSLLILLVLFLFMMIGPVYSFIRYSDIPMLGFDIGMILKIISMGIFFTYFYTILKSSPDYVNKMIHRVVLCNYSVIILNFVLAILGFGYAAYGEGGDEEFEVGFKGFFYAANELSPVLFVLTAYLMQHFWMTSKVRYYLIFLLSFTCAALMLTKTGILSCFILLLTIPILNERKKIFHFTTRKMFILCFLIITVVGVVINAEFLLKASGIYDKIMFFYDKDGLLGVLLSARDKYALIIWDIFYNNFNSLLWFTGVGGGGIEQFTYKFSAEIDSFDIYIWYGLVGLSVYLYTIFLPLIRVTQVFKLDGYPFAPTVLIISVVLFFVSQAAGHVVTSGMLGMIWGMVTARCLVNIPEHSKNRLCHV